jgi:hypothetical protein
MMPFNFFDRFLFGFAPIFITLIFILVIGGFIFATVSGAKTWSHNNAQPVLTVWAKVVTKRTNVSSHMHNNNDMQHHSSSTSYYVTFEVESGDRMEFGVTGDEFGVLVEGDAGKLTFQGTRYKVFSRNRGE